MSFWTFLKSMPGKITMVATTAIAGVAANFAGAAMVKDDLEMDAIKKGIVDGGGNVDGLTDAQIMSGWENIKQVVETDPSVAEQAKTVYRLVNDNLSQVDFQSHIQGLSIGLTIVAVVIVGAVWFLLYRRACKMAA